MTIFERVKKLNFPLGKYVVVGGIMEAHGIRPAHDIDIAVTPDFLEELIKRGWPICKCDVCLPALPKRFLKGDGVDILSELSWKDKYSSKTETLIKEADIVEGIPFAKLKELLNWKKAYCEGLPPENKHVKDIQTIKDHLKSCKCFKS